MRAIIFSFLLLMLVGMSYAVEICSVSSSDTTDAGLRYSNFVVEGPENVTFGDQVNVSFKLRNTRNHSIWFGEKGIFLSTENTAGNISHGYQNVYSSIEDDILYSYSLTLDQYGEWKLWPSYNLYDGTSSPAYWANCSFDVERRVRGTPDLIIDDLWASVVPNSSSIRIGYVIENSGDWIADATTTDVYLDGVLIGYDDVSILGPKESRIQYFYYNSDCIWDEKRLMVVADVQETASESNETNNEFETTFSCNSIGLPDLSLEYIKYIGLERSCSRRGYSLLNNIEVKIKNQGVGRSTLTHATLYVDGVNVSTDIIDPLDPNETYVKTYDFTGECTGDADSLKVVLDEKNHIQEEDESNNHLEAYINCFIEPDPTDISIKNVSLVGENGEFEVAYVIQNEGPDSSCGFRTALFIDDELVSYDETGILDSSVSSKEVFLPKYYISACTGDEDVIKLVADYENSVRESSDDNNVYSLTVHCVEALQGRADVIISSWEYDAGTDTLTFILVNNGSSSTPPTTVKAYVVNVTELTLPVPSLNAGENFIGVFKNLSLKQLYNDSTYSFRLVADADNDIDEGQNEGNNMLQRQITVVAQCYNDIKDRTENSVDCGGGCTVCPLSETEGEFEFGNGRYDQMLVPLLVAGIIIVGFLLYLTISKNMSLQDSDRKRKCEPPRRTRPPRPSLYGGYRNKERHDEIPPA